MSRENILVIAILLMLMSIYFLFIALYMIYTKKKLLSFKSKTAGKINGLVHNSLFKNIVEGDVDERALLAWGVSHGEQHWGGVFRMSIPPWLPCILYNVDGKDYTLISGEGTTRDKWNIGQEIIVLYDSSNPRKHIIQGDNSYDWTIAVHVACFMILNLVASFLLWHL